MIIIETKTYFKSLSHTCLADILRLIVYKLFLKAAVLQMLKKIKITLTVNTGSVIFSGEIYYTDPLIQLTKRW